MRGHRLADERLVRHAMHRLMRLAREHGHRQHVDPVLAADAATATADARAALSLALEQRRGHPDVGGDRAAWDRLERAWRVLAEYGGTA